MTAVVRHLAQSASITRQLLDSSTRLLLRTRNLREGGVRSKGRSGPRFLDR